MFTALNFALTLGTRCVGAVGDYINFRAFCPQSVRVVPAQPNSRRRARTVWLPVACCLLCVCVCACMYVCVCVCVLCSFQRVPHLSSSSVNRVIVAPLSFISSHTLTAPTSNQP